MFDTALPPSPAPFSAVTVYEYPLYAPSILSVTVVSAVASAIVTPSFLTTLYLRSSVLKNPPLSPLSGAVHVTTIVLPSPTVAFTSVGAAGTSVPTNEDAMANIPSSPSALLSVTLYICMPVAASVSVYDASLPGATFSVVPITSPSRYIVACASLSNAWRLKVVAGQVHVSTQLFEPSGAGVSVRPSGAAGLEGTALV